MSGIGNISNDILEEFVQLAKNPNNQTMLYNSILEPIINYLIRKTYPYFMSLILLLLVNIIILIIVMYYLARR